MIRTKIAPSSAPPLLSILDSNPCVERIDRAEHERAFAAGHRMPDVGERAKPPVCLFVVDISRTVPYDFAGASCSILLRESVVFADVRRVLLQKLYDFVGCGKCFNGRSPYIKPMTVDRGKTCLKNLLVNR